jgi:hypothetical protein
VRGRQVLDHIHDPRDEARVVIGLQEFHEMILGFLHLGLVGEHGRERFEEVPFEDLEELVSRIDPERVLLVRLEEELPCRLAHVNQRAIEVKENCATGHKFGQDRERLCESDVRSRRP